MTFTLLCFTVKALTRQSKLTAPTPKINTWGLGCTDRMAVVNENKAQQKFYLLSSSLQALILLVRPKFTDSAMRFSSLLCTLLFRMTLYSWSKMRKPKGTIRTNPNKVQYSMRLIRSWGLLKLARANRKQSGRTDTVKHPTNSSMMEMTMFCQKMEILTFANIKFMNLQTVTVKMTEQTKRIIGSEFISRKSEFKFITATFGLFTNLLLVCRLRLSSMPATFKTEELKLLNRVCRMFSRKKGSQMAGKKQRQRRFQLLISFRKRNSKPQRFMTTAKLDTTTERNWAAVQEVSITVCSVELKHSQKWSVSPSELQKQLKHSPSLLKYDPTQLRQSPERGLQVAHSSLQASHCCCWLSQQCKSKQESTM